MNKWIIRSESCGPSDLQLLLRSLYYACNWYVTASMWSHAVDISQPSASRIIKRVSEAIARMNIFLYNFPARLTLLVPQNKFDFWRMCIFERCWEDWLHAYKNSVPRRWRCRNVKEPKCFFDQCSISSSTTKIWNLIKLFKQNVQ